LEKTRRERGKDKFVREEEGEEGRELEVDQGVTNGSGVACGVQVIPKTVVIAGAHCLTTCAAGDAVATCVEKHRTSGAGRDTIVEKTIVVGITLGHGAGSRTEDVAEGTAAIGAILVIAGGETTLIETSVTVGIDADSVAIASAGFGVGVEFSTWGRPWLSVQTRAVRSSYTPRPPLASASVS
jgi:hypothetical protein